MMLQKNWKVLITGLMALYQRSRLQAASTEQTTMKADIDISSQQSTRGIDRLDDELWDFDLLSNMNYTHRQLEKPSNTAKSFYLKKKTTTQILKSLTPH